MTLPEAIKREETVTWYPWTINNKYYTADVRLCVVPSTFQMSSEIAQSMQAFIAYFDSKMVCELKIRYYSSVSHQQHILGYICSCFVCFICRKMGWRSYSRGYQWWKILLQKCLFWCVTEFVKMVSLTALCVQGNIFCTRFYGI